MGRSVDGWVGGWINGGMEGRKEEEEMGNLLYQGPKSMIPNVINVEKPSYKLHCG